MKKNVAIVYGGDSGEFDVSVMSGEVVYKHLDKTLFKPYLIRIKRNQWNYRDDKGRKYNINKDRFTLDLGRGEIRFDVVFNAIHGTPGEDGKLQGYLEMLGIPVTSSDQATSALTFNKYFCNQMVRSLGVNVARSIVIDRGSSWNADEIAGSLSLPVFVKPNRGGSSVGTTKVMEIGKLTGAIETAFQIDRQVMIEEFIPGREITCGMVTWKGDILALPLTEIVSKKEFFDYEAKYLGMSDELTPAPIPESIAKECRSVSLMIYRKLNCRGIVRCDFISNEKGLYFLEVNTIPGLSEPSIVPQQAGVHGISLKELFTEVILDAVARQ
jgi:D-alanine-D-alanine ligase